MGKLILNQINIVARDFDATLAFYRRLGFEVPDGGTTSDGIRHAEPKSPGGVRFEFDNQTLARVYNAAWRTPGGGSRALIGFSVATRPEVDNLEAFRLKYWGKRDAWA